MNVTPDTLAAAARFIDRTVPDPDARAVIREALSLDAYYGNDSPNRHHGQRGFRDVLRTPDDLLGVVTVPRAAGGRGVGS